MNFIQMLATAAAPVPDSGATGYLVGIAILALGIIARVIKNRKN